MIYMFVRSLYTKVVEGKGEWVEADEDWITEPGFGSSFQSCRNPISGGSSWVENSHEIFQPLLLVWFFFVEISLENLM